MIALMFVLMLMTLLMLVMVFIALLMLMLMLMLVVVLLVLLRALLLPGDFNLNGVGPIRVDNFAMVAILGMNVLDFITMIVNASSLVAMVYLG